MKDWKRKVVKDVAGIAGTGRKLERVYFVTSQPARAADRARMEAELEAAHGMPVKILDRAWIVEEVIDRERKDIAHDYLSVGQVVSDPMRMGPEDYSRRRRPRARSGGGCAGRSRAGRACGRISRSAGARCAPSWSRVGTRAWRGRGRRADGQRCPSRVRAASRA